MSLKVVRNAPSRSFGRWSCRRECGNEIGLKLASILGKTEISVKYANLVHFKHLLCRSVPSTRFLWGCNEVRLFIRIKFRFRWFYCHYNPISKLLTSQDVYPEQRLWESEYYWTIFHSHRIWRIHIEHWTIYWEVVYRLLTNWLWLLNVRMIILETEVFEF